MRERLRVSVPTRDTGDSGHLREHLQEMEGLLGKRARWMYLAWVLAWAGSLVFMAVTYWASGRLGF